MKMIREIKIRQNIKTFVISFVLFLVVFVLVDCAILVLSRMRYNSVSVVLLADYNYLKNYIRTEPGEIAPSEFSPIRIDAKHYYLKKTNTHYYPDAWNKPGNILLKRKCGNLYHIVFGDGSFCAATHWSYRGGEVSVKPDYLSLTNASKCIFGGFSVSCLYSLIVAITVMVLKRVEIKSKFLLGG